jgi:hypothetical protein
MPSNIDIMLELEKRGKLPENKVSILAEARKRGLVPGGEKTEAPKIESLKQSTGQRIAGAIAPYARPVLEAGGVVGGGVLGSAGGPLGSVAGAGLGYAGGRQAANLLEEYSGTRKPPTLEQAASQAISDIPAGMAMEAGGQIGGKALSSGYDYITGKISPMKILSGAYQKALSTPFGQEGKALSKETGIELTPAQETGNKLLNLAENTARKSGVVADQIHAHDIVQANQAINKINKVMDKISPTGIGNDALGMEVQWSTSNAINSVKKVRDAAASADYGAVRALAGEKPVIPVDSMKKELSDIASEYDIPGGERIAAQARQMLNKLDQMTQTFSKKGDFFDRMTVDKAMKIRSIYSKAASGTGDIFTDIDKGQSRMLAARMLHAIEKDFEIAPTAIKGVDAKVLDALKTANRNYRTYSQHIDAVQNSVLGKLLGKNTYDPLSGQTINSIAPEKIVDRLINLYPSELQTAKNIIKGNSPITWNAIRRYSIEQALQKGMNIVPSAGMNPMPLSTSKFITNLPEKKALEVLFSPKEIQEINTIQKALARMGDRSISNTSNTAIVHDFLSWLTPSGMIKGAAKTVGLKTIANAMTTQSGRQALIGMIKERGEREGLSTASKAISYKTQRQSPEMATQQGELILNSLNPVKSAQAADLSTYASGMQTRNALMEMDRPSQNQNAMAPQKQYATVANAKVKQLSNGKWLKWDDREQAWVPTEAPR